MRRPLAVLVLSLSALGLGLAATPALARSRPTVALTLPSNRVTEGTRFQLSFSSARLPSGSRLFLQKQVGTAHVWKNMATLSGFSGTTTAPGRPMGVSKYRIVARSGATVLAVSADQTLYSYGNVPMSTICDTLKAPCASGTEEIGTTVFEYAEGPNSAGPTYPAYGNILIATKTTCRSAMITFAADTPNENEPTEAFLRLLQARAEPRYASTPPQTIGTFNVSLGSGAWDLDYSNSKGAAVLTNGTFSCYTPTGA